MKSDESRLRVYQTTGTIHITFLKFNEYESSAHIRGTALPPFLCWASCCNLLFNSLSAAINLKKWVCAADVSSLLPVRSRLFAVVVKVVAMLLLIIFLLIATGDVLLSIESFVKIGLMVTWESDNPPAPLLDIFGLYIGTLGLNPVLCEL